MKFRKIICVSHWGLRAIQLPAELNSRIFSPRTELMPERTLYPAIMEREHLTRCDRDYIQL